MATTHSPTSNSTESPKLRWGRVPLAGISITARSVLGSDDGDDVVLDELADRLAHEQLSSENSESMSGVVDSGEGLHELS